MALRVIPVHLPRNSERFRLVPTEDRFLIWKWMKSARRADFPRKYAAPRAENINGSPRRVLRHTAPPRARC